MDFLPFIDVGQNMQAIIGDYGSWTYIIFFLLIFLEAGIVFTPFLPGNTLLFVAGALAASGSLDLGWLIVVFLSAAVACDTVNYGLGRHLGPRIFESRYLRAVRGDYLEKTRRFYASYGGAAIVLARPFPYIRTFTPFLAGTVSMPYRRFLRYSIVACTAWALLFLLGGYFFGNLGIVRQGIGLLVYAFVLLTVITAAVIAVKLTRIVRTSA
ncbi:MAG: VTT domain-containing protein [Methanomicrobiales archaeon]|nr:VTT domain-containing protein [Methanomicrobiales archaeon]